MLLSWRERYVAVLGANSVGLARYDSAGQTWLGSEGFIAESGSEPILALDTLQRLLVEHVRGRARLTVLLSSHYSRFGLIPWSEHISTPQELYSYAAVWFEETYGKSLQPWTLKLSPEPAGLPRVAVALPQALLNQLQEMSKERGVTLASIQPYLMAAFNHFHKRLGNSDFLFVVAEPKRSALLLARGGRWTGVRSVHLSDSDEALASLFARESELRDLDDENPATLYLHAPAREQAAPRISGVQLLVLQAPSGDTPDALRVMSRVVN